MAMNYGIIVPQGWRMDLVGINDPAEAYEAMSRVAQEAEALNFHSIWLYDHFHTVPTPTQEVTFECWTSTAALARDTKRVRIGQLLSQPRAAGKDRQYRRCAQFRSARFWHWRGLVCRGISRLRLSLSRNA